MRLKNLQSVVCRTGVFCFACTLGMSQANGEDSAAVIGLTRPTWKDLPGTDDQRHSLADYKDYEIVVVALTCNHCPVAAAYYERMNEFVDKYRSQSRATLVAFSISQMETDKLPRMKEMAKQRDFRFPYLYDASQNLGRALGGTVTPEFFVLDGKRVLAYRGAWDDNNNASKVEVHYVEDAVDAILSGRAPSLRESKARGCLADYDVSAR